MTNDLNDLVPAQEKLEWVTPKISLMEAGDTKAKSTLSHAEGVTRPVNVGPS